MIKAYVINLDHCGERWTHMVRQGRELGIDWVRVAAIDKRDKAIALRAAKTKPGLIGFILSAGAIACFESHRKAWEMIIASGHEYGAVFEDDTICSTSLPEFLTTTGWLPADCDIAKLETFLVRATIESKPARFFAGRNIVRLYGRHLGACAYVISRCAAERLLSLSQNFADPVDEFLFNAQCLKFPRLRLYQVDPAPCIQGMVLGLGEAQKYLQSGNDHNLKCTPTTDILHFGKRKLFRLGEKGLFLLKTRQRKIIPFS